MPAKLKRPCGCDAGCEVQCSDTCCITGTGERLDSYEGSEEDCPYSLNVQTDNKTVVAGMYDCAGGRDDRATVTWSGGSANFETGNPEKYCAGAGSWSVSIYLEKNQKVQCLAQSWGGPIGCSISCCLVQAP